MLVIPLEVLRDQALGVIGYRARVSLLVRNRSGRFDPVIFHIDPGSSITTIAVSEGERLRLVVPERSSELAVNTAVGRVRQRRRPGFIHVLVPGFPARPFVWPCHFVEVTGPPPKSALGLAGVLDDLRLIYDGTYRSDAPNGTLTLEPREAHRRSRSAQEVSDMPPTDILSIGLVVADHVCAPVHHLPAAGELVTTEQMILTIGGGASNLAVDLRKMNVSVAIAASVGDDAFGRIVRDVLETHGVDTADLKVSRTQPTSQTLIVNVQGQDRRFIHLIGAYGEYRAEDIPLVRVRQCRALYVGYFLLMPNLTAEGLIPVFQTARQSGVKVVVDVAVGGRGDHAAKLEKLLPHVDVFLPNRDEAEVILGEREPLRQAEAFRKMGAGTVVITLGGDGAVLVDERVKLRSGVYPMEYVDGSGGGDAFCAGFMYGMLKGHDAAGCLRFASALGASCVRAIGTTPGVFTEAECQEFIGRHELKIERV